MGFLVFCIVLGMDPSSPVNGTLGSREAVEFLAFREPTKGKEKWP